MNRSTETPTSAKTSTWRGSVTSRSAPGPMIAPVIMKPTAGGILRRRLGTRTSSAAVSVTTRSRRNEDSPIYSEPNVDLVPFHLHVVRANGDHFRRRILPGLHIETPPVPRARDNV